MIAIGLEEIMRKGRGMPECIRLIGNINARTALSRPYRIAPPPYHIAPPIPRAIRVGAATDAITRRQYAQAPHLMTPPFTCLWWRPYWLLEMFRLGGFQPPNTDAPESPRVLPYILKVSKDILIIRISGNQFVSQTRHRRTRKISRPIFGPGPHKIIRPSGEHFGACTRPRDSN